MKPLVKKFLDGKLEPGELLDQLEPRFPLLSDLESTPQDPEWHAEGNVRIHTEMVLDELRRDLETDPSWSEKERITLVLGAALHDIGKPRRTREKEIRGKKRIVSPRHAAEGRNYGALRFASPDDIDVEMFEHITGIVGYHHDPRKLVSGDSGMGGWSAVARSLPLKFLWMFEKADIRGRICDDAKSELETLELFRDEAQQLELWDSAPYTNWQSRIENEFGVPSGRESAFVLGAARYDFERGAIRSLEEAIGKTWEARSSHGELILLCGPSGSGKSTWVESYPDEAEVISLDEIRVEVGGRRERQAANGKVIQLAKERLKVALREKKAVIWDATNLRSDLRRGWIQLAHDYGAASRIVRFAVHPDILLNRNRKRKHQIPEKVLLNQIERFQWPEFSEAYWVDTVRSG